MFLLFLNWQHDTSQNVKLNWAARTSCSSACKAGQCVAPEARFLDTLNLQQLSVPNQNMAPRELIIFIDFLL